MYFKIKTAPRLYVFPLFFLTATAAAGAPLLTRRICDRVEITFRRRCAWSGAPSIHPSIYPPIPSPRQLDNTPSTAAAAAAE